MYLGGGWGGLQEADRPEEGQASDVPSGADGRVHRQPHHSRGAAQDRPEEETQEEEKEEEVWWGELGKFSFQVQRPVRPQVRFVEKNHG